MQLRLFVYNHVINISIRQINLKLNILENQKKMFSKNLVLDNNLINLCNLFQPKIMLWLIRL